VLRRNLIDLGKVKGNLAGDWAPGREEPVWVFSNLEPEKALEIYRSRMKMEPSFWDLKGLLGLEKGMSKKLENLEKWIAFMLLAYAVGLRIGETIRDEVYRGKKHQAYSGLFILLQRRLRLRLIRLALDRFRAIVQGPVLSPA
jgi:transposase